MTPDVTCDCGHGIDRHWHGCVVCPCTRTPNDIAADAVTAARAEVDANLTVHLMQRDEARDERDRLAAACTCGAVTQG